MNFMANQKKCEKCGKKYMPNHQSADCPGHERLVDMELNGVKRIRPGRLEPKPDDRLKGFELQVIDETALECGMGWAEENLINVRRIIAKTASILQAEILQLKDEHLDDLAVVGKELERVRAERLDRPELAGQIKQILNKIPYFTSGVRAGDDFIDKLLALIPDNHLICKAKLAVMESEKDKVVDEIFEEIEKGIKLTVAQELAGIEGRDWECIDQYQQSAYLLNANFLLSRITPKIRAKVAKEILKGMSRKAFLKLPMNVRRVILNIQASEIATKYTEGVE